MTEAIPQGYTTITPCLTLKDAKGAIELYKKAFGAKEESVMLCPESGKVMHAELTIGNAKFMLGEAMPESGCPATTSSFYLYVEDVDAAFKQAKSAGLSEKMGVSDMFWGDRTGTVTDKFGNNWTVATHTRDVSPEELKKGAADFAKQMKQKTAA